MSKSKFTERLLLSTVLVGAATLGAAHAQEVGGSGETDVADTIVVTGSRIQKQDFQSTSPVATIGQQQFDITATVNAEGLLNTLPQVVPGLDRTSNNPGGGIATIDLRGLGTNRTLVLVNGTRAIPATAGGTVDINTIPTALIQDVEVLTGGASAVYGSDAVSGVVNFILRDDFEGMQLGSSFETTEEGDANVFSVDLTMGANTSDGRGNAVLSLGYTDRSPLFQGERDFSRTALFDDGAGGLEPGGSSGVPATAIFAGGLADFAPDSSGVIFGDDGDIRPFVAGGDPNDFYNYAPVNYLQLPQERYQATGLASYEVNDSFEVYGRGTFTYSRVPQQLAPTPAFETVNFTLQDNPFLSDDTISILSGNDTDAIGIGTRVAAQRDDDGNLLNGVFDSDGDGVLDTTALIDADGDGVADTATALIRRRLQEVGPRISDDIFQSFQLQGGFRGAINDRWNYDTYYQTGLVTNSSTQFGNVSTDRLQQALLIDEDGNCLDGSGGCVGINIFGEGNISPEAATFISTRVAAVSEFEQTVISGVISGDFGEFFELPGGAIGTAFGVEYRDEDFDFRPSQDLAAGTISGFNSAPPVSGGFDVYEAFGELYLPILADVPFADLLEIEIAGRFSEYSTVGNVQAYKFAGTYAPTEWARVRASFNTAVRAPNIGELFSPQGENFPGAADPCSASGAPAAQSDALRQLCISTGVPSNAVFSPAIDPASGQVRSLAGGNPNLQEEEAETLTIGAVFQPDFGEYGDVTLSVDYFDIEIENAIAAFGGGANNILENCYNNPELGGQGSLFCDQVNRRADGTIDFITVLSQNAATSTRKGFDIQAEYSVDAGPGQVNVNYLGTILTEADFTPFEGADPIRCERKFGLTCGTPLPEYNHRTTFGYSMDNWNVQLLWNLIGSSNDDDGDTDFTVEKIDTYHYFDLSGQYRLNDNLRIIGGVENVLDEDLPIIGGNDEQANTYPAVYGSGVFGRTYFVRGVVEF